MNIKAPTDSNRRVSALLSESSGADWGLGPAVHRLAQGMRRLPNRAEMNSAIVRPRTRVVPLGTVNGKLNGGVRMPETLFTYRNGKGRARTAALRLNGPANALPAMIRYTRSPSIALEALERLGEFRPLAASAADLLSIRH